ncbi:hypothetical protein [Pseudomonas oryziphila]|uniref:Uncharacterized protein n=1 Tax=Pseudomonas oryziphila TaxID=2894079 RepID=A0ABN5TI22_9PSED|nr:hypothetical protein [Pseudomonas oryziphila]AZL74565.1 hypothetical protein EI693_16395 [Pseudomonas oryziphila]
MMTDIGHGVLMPKELVEQREQRHQQPERRFVAVIHGWHVRSNGFNVHELKATTQEEAEKEACWICSQRDKAFDRCAWVVVEIDGHEHLPRRLTWRERVTGRIQ